MHIVMVLVWCQADSGSRESVMVKEYRMTDGFSWAQDSHVNLLPF